MLISLDIDGMIILIAYISTSSTSQDHSNEQRLAPSIICITLVIYYDICIARKINYDHIPSNVKVIVETPWPTLLQVTEAV